MKASWLARPAVAFKMALLEASSSGCRDQGKGNFPCSSWPVLRPLWLSLDDFHGTCKANASFLHSVPELRDSQKYFEGAPLPDFSSCHNLALKLLDPGEVPVMD